MHANRALADTPREVSLRSGWKQQSPHEPGNPPGGEIYVALRFAGGMRGYQLTDSEPASTVRHTPSGRPSGRVPGGG